MIVYHPKERQSHAATICDIKFYIHLMEDISSKLNKLQSKTRIQFDTVQGNKFSFR